MSRLTHLTVVGVVLVTTIVSAAPLTAKARRPISAANADQLRRVKDLDLSITEVIWGPGRGELAFLGWEKPVEVVEDGDFRPIRKIGDRRRLIHFAASRDGRRLAWSENNSK